MDNKTHTLAVTSGHNG